MVDDHSIDVPPARNMLVVRNDDRPGVIGRVGTILGDAGINIANMAVGRRRQRPRPSWSCRPPNRIGDDVRRDLASAEGVLSVHVISRS